MGLFKVGPQVNDVEVYVHNYYEHFKRTVSRMDIKFRIANTVVNIKNNLRTSVAGISGEIIKHEQRYLSIFNMNSKDDYFKEYSDFKNNSKDEVVDAMFDFVDISANSLKEIEAIFVRRYGEVVKLHGKGSTKADKEYAFKKIQNDIKGGTFYKNSTAFFKGLLLEYNIVQKKGALDTTEEALMRRHAAHLSSAKKLGLKEAPKTLPQARKLATEARSGTDGFGVAFEVIAGMMISSLNRFISGAFPVKQGRVELVGDTDYERNYVTDTTVRVADINVGIDVKSNKVLYKKGTQRQGYGYEILSAIYLGKGGFNNIGESSMNGDTKTKFAGVLSQPNPEFLKQLTYILVNGTVFAEEGSGLKITDEAEQGMRTLFIVGGLVDFIVTYISQATKGGKSQLLLMVGEEIMFTTDFIETMTQMIESIKPETGKMFGINYKLLAEGKKNTIAEGLKTEMLKSKLVHVRNGIDTYAELFNKVGSKEMKQITGKALQRSMRISLVIPLREVFKGRK